MLDNCYFVIHNVFYKVINKLNFDISRGSRVGIVGPSGTGKSTLADLNLGVLAPQEGEISISGLSPQESIQQFPGAIAYVPQDIKIINGTIKENVCLGFDTEDFKDDEIWRALNQSSLGDFVKDLQDGIYAQVGIEGSKLSGGQRQRLGIARALLLNPKLLVLDECTSSLDKKIQKEFLETIENLDSDITIIAISHDSEFLKEFDYILRVEFGEVSIQANRELK